MNTDKTLNVLRKKIISDPEVILQDHDVMKALVAANDHGHGGNVVDLRAIAMQRLEDRLDRLEGTHRVVVAAAYENLAGTTMIQNAVLRVLEPEDFSDFLDTLHADLPAILRVTRAALMMETGDAVAAQTGFEHVVKMAAPGSVDSYIKTHSGAAPQIVTLRQISDPRADIYDDSAPYIKSEALLRLDLGHGFLPALLVLGSEDPHQFRPGQGTELLEFFSGVFGRTLRRWLV